MKIDNKWVGGPSAWVFTMVEEAGKGDEAKKAAVLTAARSMLSSRPENPADEAWLRVLVGRYSDDATAQIAAYERAYEVATEHRIRLPRIESAVALINLYQKAGRNDDSARILHDLGDAAKDALATNVERLADKTVSTVGQGLLVLGQYLTEAGRLATAKQAQPADEQPHE